MVFLHFGHLALEIVFLLKQACDALLHFRRVRQFCLVLGLARLGKLFDLGVTDGEKGDLLLEKISVSRITVLGALEVGC